MNMQSKGFPPLSSSVVFCWAHISCSLSGSRTVWVSWDTNRTGFNTRQVKLWQRINHHTRNIIKEHKHRESNLIRSTLNTNICLNAEWRTHPIPGSMYDGGYMGVGLRKGKHKYLSIVS